jgi:hypothetical protein
VRSSRRLRAPKVVRIAGSRCCISPTAGSTHLTRWRSLACCSSTARIRTRATCGRVCRHRSPR